MRWLWLILTFALAGCSGYVLPQAATILEFSSAQGLDTGQRALEERLLALGFEPPAEADAYPEFMLKDKPPGMRWRMTQARRFSRERGGLLDREIMNVTLTPYPQGAPDYLVYAGEMQLVPKAPFLELRLADSRPDGFGKPAFALLQDLKSLPFADVSNHFDVSTPPASDDQAYFNFLLTQLVGAIVWWLTAWVIAFALIALPANALLSRFNLTQTTRRVALVTIGVLLVTPIPTPAALTVLLLPSILQIFSPADFMRVVDYYGMPMVVMFAASLGLSLLAALLIVRAAKRPA